MAAQPLIPPHHHAGPPARVLLVDVTGVAREAIAALLGSLPDVTLVGEAGSARELASALPGTRPDVLVVDDRLLAEVSTVPRDARVRLVVMGLDDDPSYARRAHRLGAETWIAKEHADELLASTL